jgi:hypothetical protein
VPPVFQPKPDVFPMVYKQAAEWDSYSNEYYSSTGNPAIIRKFGWRIKGIIHGCFL